MPESDESLPDLYRAFFEAASDAIVITDDRGHVLAANEACVPIFGIDPGQLLGRPVESLIPARFHGHVKMREDYSAAPRPRSMGRWAELYALGIDGEDVPVDIALTPMVLAGQRLIACTIRDMRNRAPRGETLRVQATALRSAANGIVITDRTGTITWVNPAACSMTGYSADELIGTHTRILKSGVHDTGFYAGLWDRVLKGETWSGTIVNRRKDGTTYHEEQTIAPVVDEDGEVSHFIAIKQDVTQQRASQEALANAHKQLEERLQVIEALNTLLHDLAVRDPLTGLYNRRYMNQTLPEDPAFLQRSGHSFAVASIDIDHFKNVNDTWGHATGDFVLQQLAGLLRAHVRESDTLCRLGGEEFLVIMPGASLDVAMRRAEVWRQAFSTLPLHGPENQAFRCTISIGVALAGENEKLDEAVERADAALYVAKNGGRDRVAAAASHGESVVSSSLSPES